MPDQPEHAELPTRPRMVEQRKYYVCGKAGHIACECRAKRTESGGRTLGKPTNAKQVKTPPNTSEQGMEETNLLDLLYSSSDDETGVDVRQICISNKGSHAQCVRVLIQGVPVYGIVDSGTNITIIGSGLFRKVAATAKLRKRDLKKPDNPRGPTTVSPSH